MSGWMWWGLAFMLLGGGSWIGESVRSALKARHTRRLELQRAETERQRALDAASRPPEPICGCTHHLAKHDKQGTCHERVEAPVEWDADRKPVKFEERPCNCQRYVGPEPLGTVYAPEITDRG
ncbi:hypothetical protein G3I34_25120 [Streptomyces sp. SID8014]|uniref:hypothetical protein n=1 Tax=Streptomyces sp. SID8014 TaxID=2706097 RepID=UPI0013B8F0B8|nr:hypothetical protein [Streptomyces sp. SID8014]NEC15490.1 hypothetical protein [Streptomyces sp. SID8014]